jgi:hypothetical protein
LAFAAGNQATNGSGATTMSDAQIKQKLESEGYGNVQIKEHEKNHVDVTATKNGKTERLAVNPQTGQARADTDRHKE